MLTFTSRECSRFHALGAAGWCFECEHTVDLVPRDRQVPRKVGRGGLDLRRGRLRRVLECRGRMGLADRRSEAPTRVRRRHERQGRLSRLRACGSRAGSRNGHLSLLSGCLWPPGSPAGASAPILARIVGGAARGVAGPVRGGRRRSSRGGFASRPVSWRAALRLTHSLRSG
jgi:hypothetical protein